MVIILHKLFLTQNFIIKKIIHEYKYSIVVEVCIRNTILKIPVINDKRIHGLYSDHFNRLKKDKFIIYPGPKYQPPPLQRHKRE
jgi:hypothetical protein